MAMVIKKTEENAEIARKTAKILSPVISREKKTVVKKTESIESTILAKIKDDAAYAKVFNEPQNPALTAQYVRTYQFNQRKGNAQTKTRGDVSGSGKKPHRQKGTGKSRVGSIRTPVWRHGGVSHGPVAKDWSLEMPKKMKAKAFLIALSDKVLKSRAFFLEEFSLTEGRTKEVLVLTKSWNLPDKLVRTGQLLLVFDKENRNLLKGASNLKNIEVVNYRDLNTYQILGAKAVVFERSALDKMKEKYAKDK